jgi:two-component system, LytTR family, response regulator
MLRTIIIDDEKHQQLNLETMVKLYCHDLTIVDKASDIETGEQAIKKHNPDLVLLDINLGDSSGFDLLSRFTPVTFKVIFVTAFDHYAIKAFQFNALDYLLKPVDPDELCRAAIKASQIIQNDFNLQLDNLRRYMHAEERSSKKIIIKTFDTIHLVPVQDILYCESDNNYTRFHLAGGRQIMVSTTLKDYEDILADGNFFRVHKSFLVNLKYISRFEKAEGGSVVLEGEVKIPVASRKRDELLDLLDQMTNLLSG